MHTYKLDLTPRFFISAVAALITLLVLWEMREVAVSIVSLLFLAFIISAGFRPLVDYLEDSSWLSLPAWIGRKLNGGLKDSGLQAALPDSLKRLVKRAAAVKIGRIMAIAIVYISTIVFISFIIVILANQFFSQISLLINALPGILQRVTDSLESVAPFITELFPLRELEFELREVIVDFSKSEELRSLVSGQNILLIFNQTLGIFSSAAELLISIMAVVFLSIYMLASRTPIYERALSILPSQQTVTLISALRTVESKLGGWLVGKLVVMVIIGILTYLILIVPSLFDPSYTLGNFAFPIALLAALLEALPNVGPTLTLGVAGILALGTSGLLVVVYIAIAFIILQNLESTVVSPFIMKKAIGIDPILSILALIVGFQIGGVLGAILSIPVVGIIQIFVMGIAQEYTNSFNLKQQQLASQTKLL